MFRLVPFLLLLVACTPPAKTETTNSVNNILNDSNAFIPRKTVLAKAPLNSVVFPRWVNDPRSSDPRELDAADQVEALLTRYQSKKYLTITGRLDTAYTIVDEGFTHKLEEKTSEYFYLDSIFRLRAFAWETTYHDMGGSGRFMNVYVFDQDSLVGGTEFAYTADEVTQNRLLRLTRQSCPACGFNVDIQPGSDTIKEVVTTSTFSRYSVPVHKKIASILSSITSQWKKAKPKGDDFTVPVVVPVVGADGTYSEYRTTRYVLSRETFDNFVASSR